MKKVVNLTKKSVIGSITSVAIGTAGFGVGQMLLSKVDKPIADGAALVGGIALATSPNTQIQLAGVVLATIGTVRLANRYSTPRDGAAPNTIQVLVGKYMPNLQGLGQLGELGYAIAPPEVSYQANGEVIALQGFEEPQYEGAQQLLGVEEAASSLL